MIILCSLLVELGFMVLILIGSYPLSFMILEIGLSSIIMYEYAVTIINAFVIEQCRWVLEKHGDFQSQYLAEHIDEKNLKK